MYLTKQLQVLRGSVTEEAVQQATKTKNVSPKDVIEFVVPEIPIGCLKVAKQERKVCSVLMKLCTLPVNACATYQTDTSASVYICTLFSTLMLTVLFSASVG